MSDLTAHHVGTSVRDLETVLPFYRDVLGFPVLDRFSVSGEAFAEGVGVENASGAFVHLDANGTRLELVEYDPDGEGGGPKRLDRPGTTHVAFAVGDLERFSETLPDEVETISEPKTTASGTTILFCRDPEGNLVEVLEA